MYFLILFLLVLVPGKVRELQVWTADRPLAVSRKQFLLAEEVFFALQLYDELQPKSSTNAVDLIASQDPKGIKVLDLNEGLASQRAVSARPKNVDTVIQLPPVQIAGQLGTVQSNTTLDEAIDQQDLNFWQRVRLEQAKSRGLNLAENELTQDANHHQFKNGMRSKNDELNPLKGYLRISGNLSLGSDAPPLGPNEKIEVRWVDRGFVRAQGAVSISYTESRYEIELADARGRIEARMVNNQGRVLARAEQEVEPCIKAQCSWSLELRPTVNKASTVAVVSGDNWLSGLHLNGRSISTDQYEVDEPFAFTRGLTGDWVRVRAKLASPSKLGAPIVAMKDSLYFVSPGSEPKVPIFSEQLIKGYQEFAVQLTDDPNHRFGGVIFGKIVGASGRSFRAVIEAENLIDPIYINSMFVPQIGAKDTQFGEIFYFSGLSNGLYSLKIFYEEKIVAAHNLFVDESAVTVFEFKADQLLQTQRFYIQAFDAFSGRWVPSKIELQNRLESVDMAGEIELEQPKGSAIWVGARAYPHDSRYIPVETYYLAHQEQLFFPLVLRSWVENIKLEWGQERSLGLGFLPAQGKRHEIFVSGDEVELVFFDAQGVIIRPDGTKDSRDVLSESGQVMSPDRAVGFFIIGPAAEGKLQITLRPEGVEEYASQISFLNPGFLQVLQPFLDFN